MFHGLIPLSLFAALKALGVIAVAALGPTKRSEHHLINGWTPKPTERPIPLRHEGRVMRRQSYDDVTTCGSYVGFADYLVCSSGARCESTKNFIGCCSSSEFGCHVITTCYDFTDQDSCSGRNCAMCTESDYPLCIAEILLSGSTGTYTYYFCNNVRSPLTISALTTGSTPPISSSFSSQPAELSATAQSSGVLSESDGDNGDGVNVGAIAGGIVGGVAGLVILVGVPLGLMWRKRRQRNEAEKNIPEIAAQ